ncbi:MAG: aldehyde dehydrogenase family protein [Gammaproteobacteria bacterium]|nr:aldehyde dehydrogenase family protein [Gammaproteobacteria bacterium]
MLTSPATLRPIGAVAECGTGELTAAIDAARRALRAWQGRSAPERATLLGEAASGILRRAAALAELHARESGQVYCESLDCVRAAAAYFRKGTAPAARVERGRPAAACDDGGVAAVPVRGNASLLDWARSVSRLLALGSTVVCLPPSPGSLTVLATAACLDALPSGVVNVVTGDEAAVRARAGLAGVDSVAPPADEAAATDSIFVAQGADLDLAVTGAASLRLFLNGQRRGQSACIYVADSVADPFTERLHEFLAFLEAGDPCKRITDLGPLASAAMLGRVEDAVGVALRGGARLKLGGRRYQPWGLPGYFFQPTILIDRSGRAERGDDSIPGPVVVLVPVRDIAAAVRAGQRRGAGIRLALFAGDPSPDLRALASAGFAVRMRESPRSVDRLCEALEPRADDPGQPIIELVTELRPDWFPYRRRPPQGVESA